MDFGNWVVHPCLLNVKCQGNSETYACVWFRTFIPVLWCCSDSSWYTSVRGLSFDRSPLSLKLYKPWEYNGWLFFYYHSWWHFILEILFSGNSTTRLGICKEAPALYLMQPLSWFIVCRKDGIEKVCMNCMHWACFSHLNNVMLPLGCLCKRAFISPRLSCANKSKIWMMVWLTQPLLSAFMNEK